MAGWKSKDYNISHFRRFVKVKWLNFLAIFYKSMVWKIVITTLRMFELFEIAI